MDLLIGASPPQPRAHGLLGIHHPGIGGRHAVGQKDAPELLRVVLPWESSSLPSIHPTSAALAASHTRARVCKVWPLCYRSASHGLRLPSRDLELCWDWVGAEIHPAAG